MEKYNPLENMMVNIREEGKEDMLAYIEVIKNPTVRFQERNIYYEALKRLNMEV